MDNENEVWMVGRDSLNEVATFGPFDSREDAEDFVEQARASFAESGYLGDPGFVFDAAANRKSLCGPWYV